VNSYAVIDSPMVPLGFEIEQILLSLSMSAHDALPNQETQSSLLESPFMLVISPFSIA